VVPAVRDAFKDHRGQVDTALEDDLSEWTHRIDNDPDRDPSLWFLATETRDFAGVSLCRPRSERDPEMGWVDEKELCPDQAGFTGLTKRGTIRHPGWSHGGGRSDVYSRGFQWNRHPTG
jgi:hypothetical protein